VEAVIQAALLRGVNLGARNRVPMAALRELLVARGHADVATYLQSGNVVLRSALEPAALAARLRAEIADGLGVDVPVVVRTHAELAAVVALDPLAAVASDPRRLQVSFLPADPDPAAVERLLAADVAPEQVVVAGREVYAWHPEGLQRSPLAGLLARALPEATARNWNTVTRLAAMTGGAA
jgi:uncharacterized protein (DUF1697 family)